MNKVICILCSFLILTAGCGNLPSLPESTPQVAASPTPPTSGDEVTPPTTATEDSSQPAEDPSIDTVPTLMSPPSGSEVIAGISQGQPAPFDGIILNAQAAAWLESEPDAVQQRCQLFVTRRTGELRARLLADTDSLQLRLTTLQQVSDVMIQARDQQIQTLLQTNEQLRNSGGAWWEQALWIAGALILGAAIGIIVGVVAN